MGDITGEIPGVDEADIGDMVNNVNELTQGRDTIIVLRSDDGQTYDVDYVACGVDESDTIQE